MEYWEEVPLQEIAEIGIRASISRGEYLEMSKVISHRTLSDFPIITSDNPILDLNNPSKQYDKYPSGTILVSVDRFYRGIGMIKEESYVGKGICAIDVNSNYALPEYIFHVLRWYRMKDKERWNHRVLRNFPIPIPPIVIQNYVADIMSKISLIIQSRKKFISLLSQYTLYKYEEIVEKGIHLKPESTLDKWIENLEVGRRINSDLIESDTRVLKGKPNLHSKIEFLEIDKSEEEIYFPDTVVVAMPGDLLWYRYGDERVDDSLLIHRWETPVMLSNDWIRITPSNNISKEFLVKYLEVNYRNSKSIFKYKNREQIVDTINQLSIAIPSMHDQQIFASIAIMASKITSDIRLVVNKMELLYRGYSDQFFLSKMYDARGEN